MSDWDIVSNFIRQKNFTPKNVSIDSYIACILLHYEGDLENEGVETEDVSVSDWLEVFSENYRLEDFDYE